MSQADEKKLLDMKRQIEQAKSQSAQAQGALDQLYQRLEDEFQVKDLDGADKLLAELETEIKNIDAEIAANVRKLEADYEWN